VSGRNQDAKRRSDEMVDSDSFTSFRRMKLYQDYDQNKMPSE
jgi:hypothetical protein